MQAERAAALLALQSGVPASAAPRIVCLGRRPHSVAGLPLRQVRVPFRVSWLGARAVQQRLEAGDGRGSPAQAILHAWTPGALAACLPLVRRGVALLAEAESPSHVGSLARRSPMPEQNGSVAWIAPTAMVRRRLIEHGVRPDACALIRDAVDFAALRATRRGEVRAELNLPPDAIGLLASWPVDRGSGAFIAAWATLLVVNCGVGARLILPADGGEVRRIERLMRCARHEHAACSATAQHTYGELLSATDVVLHLPDQDASTAGLAQAMAAGRPIVASALPSVMEMLVHGHNAWLCRPGRPRDAARRILQAIESPDRSRELAEVGRMQAFATFGRQRLREQYQAVYANLRDGRAAADGITDSALLGSARG